METSGKITVDVSFDDLVALDCLVEVLDEDIKDSKCHLDQNAIRQWQQTIFKFRLAVEQDLGYIFSN